MSKTAKKTVVLSAARRSAIAKKAAAAAWRTMHSKQYQLAAKRGRKSVEKFLASRAA